MSKKYSLRWHRTEEAIETVIRNYTIATKDGLSIAHCKGCDIFTVWEGETIGKCQMCGRDIHHADLNAIMWALHEFPDLCVYKEGPA